MYRDRDGKIAQIVKQYGQEYLLRQLAEECAELIQAALKYIRAARREGTPVGQEEARRQLMLELADVHLMMDTVQKGLLTEDETVVVAAEMQAKRRRMYDRLLEGETDG